MAQGLIAAALGGFGKGMATIGEMEAKKQNELNLKQQLMDIESEKRLREDEITRERAFAYQKRDISELEPLRTAAAVSREKALIAPSVEKAEALIPSEVKKTEQVGAVQTKVDVGKAEALIPTEVKKTKEVGAAQTDIEAARKERLGKLENQLRLDFEESFTKVAVDRKEKEARRDAAVLIDLSKNKDYISALQKLTNAKTSQAEKTQAAAAALRIKNETTVIELRSKLSKLPDTAQNADARAELRRQIDDLTDRKAPSYSDVSTLANGYLVTANTIERTGTGTEEEKAEAKRYRDLAEQITEAIVKKKLPAGTGKENKTSNYKVGEERILSDGVNKGKTVVWDGTQWNVKK